MKWTHVCPLLGVTLLACATAENETPNPLGLDNGNETAGSSGETSGGSAGIGTGGGSSGSFAMGGSIQAGASTSAGTYSFSGTASFAGTFASGGVTTTAGTGSGGAGGANGGAAAGGKASGGAGGKASGGAAGTSGTAGAGGSGSAMCAGQTIPAKTTWKGNAFPVDAAYPASKVFDGDNTTRFSSGIKQKGGEFLEIDFGKVVTLNEITMFTNNGDYFRHYQLWLSNTSGDAMGTMLKEADGAQGSVVVPLATAKAGQFLRIKQTGADVGDDIAWWSLHELSVACK